MIEYLQQQGYQPHVGCTHVYFDACAYRAYVGGINSEEKIIEKAKQLKLKETECGLKASGLALVLWEMISHLVEEECRKERDEWRKALFFSYYHLADSDGRVLLEPLPELGIAMDVAPYLPEEAVALDNQTCLLTNSEMIGEIVHGLHSLALDDELTPELKQKIDAFAIVMRERMKAKLNKTLQHIVEEKWDLEEIKNFLEEVFVDYILYAIKQSYKTSLCISCICEELYPIAFNFLNATAERIREAAVNSTPGPCWSKNKKVANYILDAMHLTVVADIKKTNQCILVSKDKQILARSRDLGGEYDRIMSKDEYSSYLSIRKHEES